jgi:hypothetical protein
MARPRAAPAAALLLIAACTLPSGEAVDECNTSWQGLEPRIVSGAQADLEPIPIACIRQVDDERISIGFELPPGPDCYELAAVDLVESANAVSVTLLVALQDNVGGACPPEPVRTVTEIDLQSPVGDRELLDGSR